MIPVADQVVFARIFLGEAQNWGQPLEAPRDTWLVERFSNVTITSVNKSKR